MTDAGSVEPGPRPPPGRSAPRPGRSGCVWALVGVVTAIVGVPMIALALGWSPIGSGMPELVRPTGVAEGSVTLAGGAGASVEVVAVISMAAVNAAARQDGTVYFELDVIGADATEPMEVEVARRDVPGIVSPSDRLPAGGDVRWTLTCPPDEPCDARFELTFAQGNGGDLSIDWRLTAEVRPQRSTEVEPGATIELRVEEPR